MHFVMAQGARCGVLLSNLRRVLARKMTCPPNREVPLDIATERVALWVWSSAFMRSMAYPAPHRVNTDLQTIAVSSCTPNRAYDRNRNKSGVNKTISAKV